MSDNPKEKLWKALNDAKYYTKSYEEFEKQFSSKESISKLYNKLNEANYYTKSEEDFNKQFFFSQDEVSTQGSSTPAKPSVPSGANEARIKELTVAATQAAASGDTETLNEIKAEIEAIKNPTPKVETPFTKIVEANPIYTSKQEADADAPNRKAREEQVRKNTEIALLKKYRATAPSANTPLPLAELELKEKELRPTEFGTTPEYENVRTQLDEAYGMLERDYFAYLQSTDLPRAEQYANRIKEIEGKSEKSLDDMKFLKDLRSEALAMRMNSDKQAIEEIKSQIDFGKYQKQITVLASESERLQKQAQSLLNADGTPKSPTAEREYNAIVEKINGLQDKVKAIKEETGVEDEILTELNNRYSTMVQTDLANDLNNSRFPELETVNEINARNERIKQEIVDSGNMAQKGGLLIMDFMNTVGSGTVKMLEVPKVFADMAGYGNEAGWTDALYDLSMDLNEKRRGAMSDAEGSTLYDLGEIFAKGAGNVVQFALGGELASGVKVVDGVRKVNDLRQKAGIVGTAFLMSQGDYYREALEAGASQEDAAAMGTAVALAVAASEAIVSDVDLLKNAGRQSIREGVKALKNGTGSKKDVIKYVGDYFQGIIKQGVQEGAEEVGSQAVEDVTKEGINAIAENEFYKDTFNLENYAEAALAGFITGGGLKAIQRGKKSPIDKETQRMVADKAEVLMSDIATVAPEVVGEVAGEIETLTKINNGLNSMPQFESLAPKEKDEVLDLLVTKKQMKEAASEAGITDEVTKKEIEKIDAQIDGIFAGKKVGEEVELEAKEGEVAEKIVIGGEKIEVESQETALPEVEESQVDVVEEAPVGEVAETVTPVGTEVEESPVFNEKNVTNEGVKIEDAPEAVPTTLPSALAPNRDKKETKSRTQKAKEYLEKIKGFTPSTVSGAVRQYFINGGKVSSESIRKELGLNESRTGELESTEQFSNVFQFTRKDADSIEKLAERLQTDIKEQTGNEVELDEVRNAIIDVLSSENTATMRSELDRELSSLDESFEGTYRESMERAQQLMNESDYFRELERVNAERAKVDEGIESGELEKDYTPFEMDAEDIEFVDYIFNLEQGQLMDEYFDVINENGELDEQLFNAKIDEYKRKVKESDSISVPPTESTFDTTRGEGEQRTARRAERIESNKKYKATLDSYTEKYTSVNVDALNSLVNDYMPTYRQAIEDLGLEEANKQTREFLLDLIRADVGYDGAYTRSAFAILTAQKILAEAFILEDVQTVTTFNEFLDFEGRLSGTKLALFNQNVGNDPLLNAIQKITREQTNALKGKVSSGRTKKEVVDELTNEINKQTSEAADELFEDKEFETKVSTSVEKKKKPERKVTNTKRAELNKRKEAALKKIGAALSKGVGFAALPENEAQRSKDIGDAIVELAKVQIQLGAYTIWEAVSKVFKEVTKGGFNISKRRIEEVLQNAWDTELKSLSDEARMEEAVETLSDAIEGKDVGKSIKTLAKALRISNPDFIKSQKKGRRITDAQAVKEILENKEQAQLLLGQALEFIRREIEIEGKYLDTVTVKKPKDMTDEQWDALRAKYVFSKFKSFVDGLLGNVQRESDRMFYQDWMNAKEEYEAKKEKIRQKQEQKERERLADLEVKEAEKALKEVQNAQKKKEASDQAVINAIERRRKALEQQRLVREQKERERLEKELLEEAERELKEAEKLYQKRITDGVRKVAQKFYKEPKLEQSLAEALIEEMPFLTIEDAIKLQKAVEDRIKVLIDRKDNRRLKMLMKELTDGKEEADLNKVVAKVILNRGAINSSQFANLISNFLGFKGVPQNVVTQLMAMFKQTANMPSGLAKQMSTKMINNISRTYGESNWQLLADTISEVIVRNILGAFKTVYTGGISVFLGSIPAVAKSFIIRPIKTARAAYIVASNIRRGNLAVTASIRETFVENNIPYAREIPTENNPYARDRAWVRVRNTGVNDLLKIWRTNKGKAVTIATLKAIQTISFQGKYVGITNMNNNLMAFLDYINIASLRDMYVAIDVQRKIDEEKLGLKGNALMEEIRKRMYIDSNTLATFESETDAEIKQMTSQGLPIPTGYRQKRIQEKIASAQPIEVLEKAHQKALEATLMNNPNTAVGSIAYAVIGAANRALSPKVDGQLGMGGFAVQMSMLPLTMFSRITIVLAEKGTKSAPYINLLQTVTPWKWELDRDGKPTLAKNENGEVYMRYRDDMREYGLRVAAAGAISALITYFLSYAFEDEEVIGENNEPVIDPRTNKPMTRQVYKGSAYLDFYGNDPKVKSNEKGTQPRNVVRVYTGKDENGVPMYEDIPFTLATPWLMPFVAYMGEIRDRQRYTDEKLEAGIVNNEVVYYLNNERFDMGSVVAGTYMKAMQTDFNGISRIIKGVEAGKGVQPLVDVMFLEPSKRVVSSRAAEELTKQVQKMNGQHQIYVNYSMKEDFNENLVEYLMKDVWFTDPFIPDRKNLESVDPFGNRIDFPPYYSDFIGMFGTTTTYALADHERKHKDLYNLFKDESKGYSYDPKVLPFPQRYSLPKVTLLDEGAVTVKTDDKRIKVESIDVNLRREIADLAYENFGKYCRENLEMLQNTPYELRANELGYFWDLAKYDAVIKYFPDSTRKKPKRKEAKEAEPIESFFNREGDE